jgi:pimeloyl-ACP methyl ester carboxylesterase
MLLSTDMHHRYQLSSGHTLHYTAWGNPLNPAVVCVHGLTRNARDFDFLAHYLSLEQQHHCGFYVLCVDVIGRGESSWASDVQDYSIPNYAHQLLEWLNGLKLITPHWIGTSMGGLIAMALQLIAPNRLGKVVLNDIGPSIDYQGLARIADYIGKTMRFNTRADAHAYAKQVFVGFGAKSVEEWSGLCDHYFIDIQDEAPAVRVHYDPLIAVATKNYVANLTEDLRIQVESELWRSLSSFQQPVHVLRGEYSDLLSVETVIKMKNSLSLLSASTVPDCAHAPHLMNVSHAKIIYDFLQNS